MNSEKENDDILQFLNDSNFGSLGESHFIWLGMNSAKQAGSYIIDNSRPPFEINWFNWDQYSDENDSESKNSESKYSEPTDVESADFGSKNSESEGAQ